MKAAPHLPIGFAHRGARAECRDNTLKSFARALELGAEALESDVWLTADGVAVLDHDGLVWKGLRRTPIRSLRRADLPAHIPTLADLYGRTGASFELSLDVKDKTAAAAAVAVADAAGVTSRLWLCGAGSALASWRALSPFVRLVASTRAARLPGGFDGGVVTLAGAGVDAVNLRWREWTPARVGAVHGAGLLAFAWDAQRHSTITSMLSMGIDAVYSDHVTTMTRAIDRWRHRG